MFIFNRPVSSVAAGLAVALLTVCLDNSCQSRDNNADASLVAEHASAACAAPAPCGIVRAGS